MTQDEIIEMARQSSVLNNDRNIFFEFFVEEIEAFATLIAAKEQDRCCSIVFAQCESDNVAQRTVDVIRGKA
jgi:ABC-type hemin transport system ATPase subunit